MKAALDLVKAVALFGNKECTQPLMRHGVVAAIADVLESPDAELRIVASEVACLLVQNAGANAVRCSLSLSLPPSLSQLFYLILIVQ